MQKNTIIDGIAASEHLDSSGESLSIEGMDISSLGGPESILNWEHGSKEKPTQVVGKVTFAKKILKKSDAKNKRENYFWDKVKKPFVYIKAELFDGVGHSGAQDVAAMMKYNNKDKGKDSRLVVGFSIEGGKIEKKGMSVTKSVARDVAITVKPCNKVCDAEIVDTDKPDEFLYKNQGFDCEVLEKGFCFEKTMTYRDLIISDIKKNDITQKEYKDISEKQGTGNTFKQKIDKIKETNNLATSKIAKKPESRPDRKFLPDKTPKNSRITYGKKDPLKTSKVPNWSSVYKTENNMRKALVAGMMGGSPDSKTGMAALSKEDLDKKMKKVNKSQPRFEAKELGIENRPEMNVKHVDPDKSYTTKEGKTYSAAQLEGKKLANKYTQYQKEQAGAESLDEFTTEDQDYIKEQRENVARQIDPSGNTEGLNYYDKESGINESYDFSTGQDKETMKETKGKGNYPTTKQHESIHNVFGQISSKFSEDHSKNLAEYLLDNFFDKNDVKGISDFVSMDYEKDDPRLYEEKITHILDLITSNDVRDSHEDMYQQGKVGNVDYKKLKRGWIEATNFMKTLNKDSIEKINSDYIKNKQQKVKQPKIQRIAPGKSGLK